MKQGIFLIILVLAFVAIAAPFAAQAVWVPGQPVVPCGIDRSKLSAEQQANVPPEYTNPCDFNGIVKLANNIISIGIYLAVLVAVAMFAFAGWLYLTSAGDTGKMKQAHTIFTNAAFGFIFVLVAWLIVTLILVSLASKTFKCSEAAKIILTEADRAAADCPLGGPKPDKIPKIPERPR